MMVGPGSGSRKRDILDRALIASWNSPVSSHLGDSSDATSPPPDGSLIPVPGKRSPPEPVAPWGEAKACRQAVIGLGNSPYMAGFKTFPKGPLPLAHARRTCRPIFRAPLHCACADGSLEK